MIPNTFPGFGSMTVRNTNMVTMSSFVVMIQCIFHEKRSEKLEHDHLCNYERKLQALDSEYIIYFLIYLRISVAVPYGNCIYYQY